MITVDLMQAIVERLLSDTGDGGLFAPDDPLVSGVYGTMVETLTNDKLPAIVVTLVSDADQSGFAYEQTELLVQISVMDNRNHGSDRCSAALRRVYGDAMDQPDRTPTHGLQRWSPDGLGDRWQASAMVRTTGRTEHTEDRYHFIEEYRVFLRKNLAS